MRKVLNPLVVVLVMLVFVACATWKQNMVTGYKATGITLKEVHATGKTLCDEGTLSVETCAEIKTIYNKAREVYLLAGESLKVAINTEDALVKEKSIEAYYSAIDEVATLLPQIIELVGNIGGEDNGS